MFVVDFSLFGVVGVICIIIGRKICLWIGDLVLWDFREGLKW